MTEQPSDEIIGFMANLRAWTSGTQRFALKVHALSLLQRSRAAELRVEAEEIMDQVRTRRRSEGAGRSPVRALRQSLESESYHADPGAVEGTDPSQTGQPK